MVDLAKQCQMKIRGFKFMGLRCVLNLIDFSQTFIQGVWGTDSSYKQLTFFQDDDNFRILKKKFFKKAPSLSEIQKNTENPDFKLFNLFDEEKRSQLLQEIKLIPNMSIEVTTFVKEEEQIMEDDILTLKIKIVRENVPEGEKQQMVHNPKNPFFRKEKLYIIVGSEENNVVIFFKVVSKRSRVIEEEFQMRAPPPGTYGWNIFVKSDSYIGVDYTTEVKFTSIPRVERVIKLFFNFSNSLFIQTMRNSIRNFQSSNK